MSRSSSADVSTAIIVAHDNRCSNIDSTMNIFSVHLNSADNRPGFQGDAPVDEIKSSTDNDHLLSISSATTPNAVRKHIFDRVLLPTTGKIRMPDVVTSYSYKSFLEGSASVTFSRPAGLATADASCGSDEGTEVNCCWSVVVPRTLRKGGKDKISIVVNARKSEVSYFNYYY